MNTTTFKQRLQSAPAVLAPGIYDALTALVAEQAGFEALYLSGASIAYTRLGRSDVVLTTATEVAETSGASPRRSPPIVDADTGFGNALYVQRTARLRARRRRDDPARGPDLPETMRASRREGRDPERRMCGKLRAALDARHPVRR
jgi:2-methylisocitrate lyase-like PEP mutase family enzyme